MTIRAAVFVAFAAAMLAACGGDNDPTRRNAAPRVTGHALALWSAYDELRGECTPEAARAFTQGEGGPDPCMPSAVYLDAVKRIPRTPCVLVPRGTKWIPLVDAAAGMPAEIRRTGWNDDAAVLTAALRDAPSC